MVKISSLPDKFRTYAITANKNDNKNPRSIDSTHEADKTLKLCKDNKRKCDDLEQVLKKSGYKLGPTAKRYAIIINGDKNSTLAKIHQDNVHRAYNSFKKEGFEKTYVLSPNDINPTVQNIENAFKQVKQHLNKGDSLVVYTTGHGSLEKNNEAGLELPGTNLSASKLAELFKSTSNLNLTVVMDQCYGGKFVTKVAADNVLFLANTTKTETGFCEEFSTALFGSKVKDVNRDGVISMKERADAAARVPAFSGITLSVGKNYIDRGLGQVASLSQYKDKLYEVKSWSDFNSQLDKYKQGINIIFFTAKWCEACKGIEKEIHKIAKQFAGRVQFLRVDIQKNKEVAKRYSIGNLPMVFMVQGEREAEIKLENFPNLAKQINLAIAGKHPYFNVPIKRLFAQYKSAGSAEKKLKIILAMRRVAKKDIPRVVKFIIEKVFRDKDRVAREAGEDTLVGLSTIDHKTFDFVARNLSKKRSMSYSVQEVRIMNTLGKLTRLNPQKALPYLMKILNEGSGTYKTTSLFILQDIGEPASPALPLLYKLINDPDVGDLAIQTIGKIGRDKKTIEILLEALKKKKLRGAALLGLFYISSDLRTKQSVLLKPAFKPLLEILRAKKDMIKCGLVLKIFGNMGKIAVPAIPQIKRFLNSKDNTVQRESLISLLLIGKPAAKVLPLALKKIKKISDPMHKHSWSAIIAAICVLNKKQAKPYILKALKSKDKKIRRLARLLSKIINADHVTDVLVVSDKEITDVALAMILIIKRYMPEKLQEIGVGMTTMKVTTDF